MPRIQQCAFLNFMQRYFLQLSYNGSTFNGWQVQKNAPYTIQQVINQMLSKVLNEPVNVIGCGRTDTGVHASEYFAHFDTNVDVMENHNHWIFKFNHALPPDIAIQRIIKVDERANARYDARARTYKYFIVRKKNTFKIGMAYFFYGHLDVEAMNEAAKELFNYNDFGAFAKSNTQNKTNICQIYKAEWEVDGDELIFTISANRFLRGMVRAIVGTLMRVGKGIMTVDEFKKVIESKDREKAGLSVKASGLYLVKVEYPEGHHLLNEASIKE